MSSLLSRPQATVLLTIAGSDSGGGAGIQADLKTFEAHGMFGTSAITSVTAQNTVGVRAIHNVPTVVVREQLEAIADDFDIAAIKIGLLPTVEIVECVRAFLVDRCESIPVVLDPVMVATSGDQLLDASTARAITQHLVALATIVTPNVDEAAVLAECKVDSLSAMLAAARRIVDRGARSVLVKGGHIDSVRDASDGTRYLTDVLFDGEHEHLLRTRFIESRSTHGTGCTLSSAIACRLALGASVLDAVRASQRYVNRAIATAPNLGRGHGPLNHAVDVDRFV